MTVTLRGFDITPRQERLRTLLGILVLASPQGVPRGILLEAMRADEAAELAPVSVLHVAVSRLRAWMTTVGEGRSSVIRDATGYRLDAPAAELDSVIFDRLVARAGQDGLTPDERFAALERACALWRGPVLADLPQPVGAAVHADRWQQRHTDTVRALAVAAREAGHPQRALGQVEALAGRLPLDEVVQAELIRLLAATGRRADALLRYEHTREQLTERLGVNPGDPLHQAYLDVLRADRDAPAAAPSPAAEAAPRQLPARTGDFVGRAEALAELDRWLRPPAAGGLIAVTGPAGTGKTAIAVEVAHRLRSQFPDGQLFIDLQGIQPRPVQPAEALNRFLRALGVDGEAIPGDLDDRAALFRSRTADRRMLILLDNIADEGQVRPLLPAGDGCAVLMTSRRQPAVLPGVRLLDLGALDQADALALLDRLCGDHRVALDRAEAIRVVGFCDHLPLAIRVTGARMAAHRGWSLRRVARMLTDERRRLDALTAGDLTVRASIQLSLDALEAGRRRLFRLLGLVDSPDFPAWAAAALLGVPAEQAEELLTDLVDARLVEEHGEDLTGQMRYRLHDLVHVFARELALRHETERDRQAALRQMALALLVRAAEARSGLPGPPLPVGTAPVRAGDPPAPTVTQARTWFEAERMSIGMMVAQAAAQGDAELAWRLAACSVGFYDLCSYPEDWQRTHETALAASRQAGDELGLATTRWGIGELHISCDRYDEALTALSEAENYFQGRRDRHVSGRLLTRIGMVRRIQGQVGEAERLLVRAVGLLGDPVDAGARAYALNCLAGLNRDRGERDAALAHLHEALRTFRRLADRYGEAGSLDLLGKSHAYWDEPAPARRYLTAAEVLYRAIGDRSGALHSRVTLGEMLVLLGEPDAARRALHTCLTDFRRLGERFGEAKALLALGRAEHGCGDFAAARQALERALHYWREVQVLPLQARTLDQLALVHRSRDDAPAARTAWTEALELYRRLEAPDADRITGLLAQLGGDRPQAPPPAGTAQSLRR